jgi:hypothetical protein
MLIKQRANGGTFVNIKQGNLVIAKKNEQGEPDSETFASIKGVIFKVEFIEEEFKGKKYEKAKIYLTSDNKNYILQMGTDSGYFRGFCNSLKSGSPTKELTITPSSKEVNGKNQTTCFIEQNGKFLKHFYTKDFNGDLPPLEKVEFKGVVHYDNKKQIEFWKKWLIERFENTPDVSVEPEITKAPDELKFDNNDDLPF